MSRRPSGFRSSATFPKNVFILFSVGIIIYGIPIVGPHGVGGSLYVWIKPIPSLNPGTVKKNGVYGSMLFCKD